MYIRHRKKFQKNMEQASLYRKSRKRNISSGLTLYSPAPDTYLEASSHHIIMGEGVGILTLQKDGINIYYLKIVTNLKMHT